MLFIGSAKVQHSFQIIRHLVLLALPNQQCHGLLAPKSLLRPPMRLQSIHQHRQMHLQCHGQLIQAIHLCPQLLGQTIQMRPQLLYRPTPQCPSQLS